jgi:hypothetical protein
MKREDDQELWDLLGKTEAPKLSPFFARNVVRQVRTETAERTSFWSWLRPRVLVPASAAAAAILLAAVATFGLPGTARISAEPTPELLAKIDPRDFEVIADLDVLIAWEEDPLWDEVQQL